MISLLIVDDDDGFRTTLGRDLTAQGYQVRVAQDADEAMSTLRSGTIDVLLTDLRMPGADGIDLLGQVRTLSARTRTILMSGYASARDYQRAIECGAVRVLCKPFTSSELHLAIRQAIDCETGFRGSIHGLSIVDLLQMFHYARRSLAIVVDGWAPGHVFLEDGRVIHATYRSLVGEPALREILAMPAGSLRTMVLPEGTPHTITGSLEALLLDALRMLDEGVTTVSDDTLAQSWELDAPDTLEALDALDAPVRPRLATFSERLRRIDGFRMACLVDSASGVILGVEGDVEGLGVQGIAAGYSELYRAKQRAVAAFVPDDRMVDMIITFSRQYHLLHAIRSQPDCFVLAVFDRVGTLALVTRALDAAEVALEG